MNVDRYLRMIAGVAIGFYQLVPDDEDPSETGRP